MQKAFFLLIINALFLLGCAEAQDVQELRTTQGYRFFHHVRKGGPQPKVGEKAVMAVDVWVGKHLLSSSRKTGNGTYEYEIGDTSQMEHVPPVIEAAMLMGIGDSATIYQPIDDYMRQFIPPTSRNEKEIHFDIVLLGVRDLTEQQREKMAAMESTRKIREMVQATVLQYTLGNLDKQLRTLPSGLKMLVSAPGNGPKVREGEAVQVHYMGCLTDGNVFQNSYESRKPLDFPAGTGQMIPGFDEGVMQMQHGGRAYLFVPAQLGYGAKGSSSVPPNAELIFYVEVL
jgi:FKBP-type peptidyl-prolyl cis-trans isomerase